METLDEYISNLKHFRKLLEEDDFGEVFKEMERTNHIKEVLNGINQNEEFKIAENGK